MICKSEKILRSFRPPRCRPGYNSAELPWEYHPETRHLEEGFRELCQGMKGAGIYVISNETHVLYVGKTEQGGHRVGASLARVYLMTDCEPQALKAVFYPVGNSILDDAENTLIGELNPTLNYYRRYPRVKIDPRPPWVEGEGVLC